MRTLLAHQADPGQANPRRKTPKGVPMYPSWSQNFPLKKVHIRKSKFGQVQTGISNFTGEVRRKTPAPERGVFLLHERMLDGGERSRTGRVISKTVRRAEKAGNAIWSG